MADRSPTSEPPAGFLPRALPIAGLASIAVLALAWCDLLPGGYFLRRLVDANSARSQRELALHAAERLRAFANENEHVAPGAIVFIGSSTIERFPLAECFPGKPCVNRGILSASAPMLEHFADVLAPKTARGGIVVYAGSIDLREPGDSADAAHADSVAAQVMSLVDELRAGRADVPLAMIGVLPARRMSTAEVEALAHLNASLREQAHRREIPFIDVSRAPITSPSGSLAEEQSADDLHLDRRGYETLARWILADGGEIGRRLSP
jgi:lysophospholipase L1-like esterase